ncbi:hypothetical protein SOM11_00955 [Frigoribacterium sp. CFBP9039]|uniref:hypothetical protein n=1 Tax=Frigoribacterium sp. CFBP9029 TaxID=3096541 RepID=UPI002A6B8CE7|nr:hypothetical protein [Frigoribacterium sp. CFBP9039]MDY0944552.1 hypothetical protein [Frigoribacterium sp. CFBP9039]
MSREWLVVLLVTVCVVSIVDAMTAALAGVQSVLWSSIRVAAMIGLIVAACRRPSAER